MKQITIAGNIGRDAETRHTQGGNSVTGWPVAVEDRATKTTIWFDCSLWGERGTKLASYLAKGTRIVVTGELGTREHNGKTYLTVKADNVTLMGGGQDRGEPKPRINDKAMQGPGGAPAGGLDGDEIPFIMEWR